MENFIYSMNATMPVFLVIAAGYFLRRIGILNEEFIKAANKFNFKVTLPMLLFQDLAGADIQNHFDGRYVLFCAVVTTICFWCIWLFARLFLKDRSILGAFVQASFRGSAAVLGLAFIQNIYKDSGMAPLMIVGAVPLYNIYSVIVLTFEGGKRPDGSRIGQEGMEKAGFSKNMKNAAKGILTNPILIGIVLGLLGSIFHFYDHAPFIITKTISNFAAMASPLALIAIGAGFEGKKAVAKLKPTIAASLIKLVLQPLLFLPAAMALGFREQEMIAILVMLGSPTTPSCYIMAKNMKNDGTLTSSVVVVTTLLSSITLTVWIYLLRTLGYL